MYLFNRSGGFLAVLFLLLAAATYANKDAKPFNCKGGSVYFAAHPADILLYQNPDLFRDLYVWKCTTAVLFTSGDRGVKGNYSRGIENGLANAIAFMASENDISPRSWAEADVQFEGEMALLKSLKNWPQVQLLFLRLPDGKPDGTPYREQGLSLKQLYDHRIHTISATDGRAYYGIDDLKDVIATILKKREPNDIRILQHKEPMKIKLNDEDDHADHLVSAKLVAEVIEREELKTNIITYESGGMHHLPPTLNFSHIVMKKDTYMQYAVYDRYVCPEDMLPDCDPFSEKVPKYTSPHNDDVGYIKEWIAREYYVV